MSKFALAILLSAVAIAGFTRRSDAQYMWLDSNGDGVNTTADVMNGVGVPTTVDVYLDTNNNKDGSVAVCNTGDGLPTPNDLDICSYVVNLALTGGTANFTNFINEQAGMTTVLFPAASTSTAAAFANGSGTFLAPGTYFLMRVTCTLTANTAATLNIVGSALTPDPTSFGTHCSGSDFVNTYALGPNVCCSTDWTDTAGLSSHPPGNSPPTVINPGPKSAVHGVLLTYTVTATDPDAGQSLTFSLGAGAPAGAAITAGGVFSWTPAANQCGTFPVTYIATDNGTPPLSGSATNTIFLGCEAVPTVNNPGPKTTPELALLAYTVTATDPDGGQTLTFTLGAGAPLGASITAGGNFTWTPAEAQGPGAFAVTYVATDNGSPPLSGNATNTITVNEVNTAPVVTNPGPKSANPGVPLTYTVTATDADIPANTITFTLGAGAPAGAAITAAGVFSWTPAAAQTGSFAVTYNATDNGTPPLSGSATNTITSPGEIGPPTVTNPGNKTTNELALLSYTVTATDPDAGSTLTFTLGAGAPAGAAITAGGVFTWNPTEAQGPGTFPVTYTATNNGSPPAAGSATNTITVNEVNQAPIVSNPGGKTTGLGGLLAYTVIATDPDLPANAITFTLGPGAPVGAVITSDGHFTWTPQVFGTFQVTYIATDNGTPPLSGSATNVITVPQFSAPVVANPGDKTVDEQTLLAYTLTATDADAGQTLTFTLGAGAPAGAAITAAGAFTWTPTEAQGPGTFPVTYIATDNGSLPLSGTATNTITVNEVNRAPVVTNPGPKSTSQFELLAYTVTATDADLPANTLTFTLGPGAPVGASITAGGAFTWTPSGAQGFGSYPVTYIATDNGTPPLSGSATNTIVVGQFSTAPVVTPPGNKTVDEGALLAYTVIATDADVPPQTLTFTLGSGAPAGAAITPGGDFTWTPNSTQGGANYQVIYTAFDDGVPPLAGSAANTITVNNLNLPPTADAGGPYTGFAGTPVAFSSSGSSDPDGDPLADAWNFGDGGTSTSPNPTHSYGVLGVYTVTLRVTDPGGLYGDDGATATILEVIPAAAFAQGGNSKTNLGSGKPTVCFQIQPDEGGFDVSDVDLGSVVMISPGTGSVGEIGAISGKTAIGGDKNGDGIAEITACFTKDDLRLLWSDLPPGNNLVDITFEGNLFTGGTFHALINDYPVKVPGGGALAATISPNPLNPQATLSLSTSKPGLVKVAMYDVQGRLVRTLAEYPSAPAGFHEVTIDGLNSRGVRLASGRYFVVVNTPDGEEKLSVTILK